MPITRARIAPRTMPAMAPPVRAEGVEEVWGVWEVAAAGVPVPVDDVVAVVERVVEELEEVGAEEEEEDKEEALGAREGSMLHRT
jgi:hypothetical protein